MFGGATSSIFRRNVSWQMVGTGSQAVLSGLILLVMGRQLQATGFGQYAIIIGFVTVANLLIEPRMQDVAARQFWDMASDLEHRQKYRKSFIDLLVFESLLKLMPLTALAALSGPLVQMAKLPPDAGVLIVIAAAGNYLAKVGYGLSTGVLRVLGRSDQFTYCGSGEQVLRLACLLFLIRFSDLTVANSVIVLSITLALSNFAQLMLAVRHMGGMRAVGNGWQLRGIFARLRAHRRLLLSNVGLSAADLMNKDLDVTILSPVASASEIGVYKMAKNLALLAWRAVDPFYLALMPELSRRMQLQDMGGVRLLLKRSAFGLAVFAFSLCTVGYLLIALFGQALLGQAFANIPGIIVWMLAGVIISAPLVWGHPLSVALNRGDIPFIGSLLGLVIGLASFFVLVPIFGIQGAAISWSLSFTPHFLYTSATSYRLFRRLRRAQ